MSIISASAVIRVALLNVRDCIADLALCCVCMGARLMSFLLTAAPCSRAMCMEIDDTGMPKPLQSGDCLTHIS